MAAAPTGHGYWLAASDGGIFAFGSALVPRLQGRPAAQRPGGRASLRIPQATATGRWPLTAGSSTTGFSSSAPGSSAPRAVSRSTPRWTSIAAAPTGNGYTLRPPDGGIFNYGQVAGFFGLQGRPVTRTPPWSAWSQHLPQAQGYWEFASDGGVFTYGTAAFLGSMGGTTLNAPVVGGAALTRR